MRTPHPDSFDMSSPIDVMDEVSLAEQGTPNLGEVLRNSTYNYGVESVGNILAANPQLVGNIGPNFRGLGERATLTLLDGRRTSSGNLANMYPQIMIERTESPCPSIRALPSSSGNVDGSWLSSDSKPK